jgi:hypothetical protein
MSNPPVGLLIDLSEPEEQSSPINQLSSQPDLYQQPTQDQQQYYQQPPQSQSDFYQQSTQGQQQSYQQSTQGQQQSYQQSTQGQQQYYQQPPQGQQQYYQQPPQGQQDFYQQSTQGQQPAINITSTQGQQQYYQQPVQSQQDFYQQSNQDQQYYQQPPQWQQPAINITSTDNVTNRFSEMSFNMITSTNVPPYENSLESQTSIPSAPPTTEVYVPYHLSTTKEPDYSDSISAVESMYPPQVSNPVCNKYDISSMSLIDTKGRKQIVFIDDSYSNITEAFVDENRSVQIIDACRMIVELNSVHNNFEVRFRMLNSFYNDTNDVFNTFDYDNWIKNIQWEGGTEAGVRMNTILEEYFTEWNHNSETIPVNIIYIGDGLIEDQSMFTACIVNASQECERRKKPRQITFQLFQVGEDTGATHFFRELDDNLKTTHKMKNDIVDCVYGTMPLIDKIKKAMIGATTDYVDAQSNY